MQRMSFKRVAPFLFLAGISVAALFVPSLPLFNDNGKYSSADMAWIIVATALVFVITPSLVVGAVAERIRFTSYILFIALFSLLVYAPIAHWSWNPEGFLFKMGALDFAGGTVVHISAGCAALAGALVLKRRQVHIDNKESTPANIPYVLIGTGLLWFGWFGFNAGSALAANSLAVSAFSTTNT